MTREEQSKKASRERAAAVAAELAKIPHPRIKKSQRWRLADSRRAMLAEKAKEVR